MLAKNNDCFTLNDLEPIGSASPKFSTADKSSTFVHTQSSSIALVCPAQGFPLPAFR